MTYFGPKFFVFIGWNLAYSNFLLRIMFNSSWDRVRPRKKLFNGWARTDSKNTLRHLKGFPVMICCVCHAKTSFKYVAMLTELDCITQFTQSMYLLNICCFFLCFKVKKEFFWTPVCNFKDVMRTSRRVKNFVSFCCKKNHSFVKKMFFH